MYMVICDCAATHTKWFPSYDLAVTYAKEYVDQYKVIVSIVKEVAVVALPKVEPVVTKVDERL